MALASCSRKSSTVSLPSARIWSARSKTDSISWRVSSGGESLSDGLETEDQGLCVLQQGIVQIPSDPFSLKALRSHLLPEPIGDMTQPQPREPIRYEKHRQARRALENQRVW